MQQTPRGIVPWKPAKNTDWRLHKVKNIYSITLGKMLQNSPNSPDDIEVPYLKAQHVQWDGVQLDNLPLMWASPHEVDALRVCNGDLLVCEGGEAGRAAIVSSDPPENCIIQNALHLVRSNDHGDLRFLKYVLQYASITEWLAALSGRATISHFTGEQFNELWCWFPALPEQRSVAAYLDQQTARLDELIAAKQQLLELLTEKRQALLTHAVTRGLDPSAPRRDSGVPWLGEIPAHWEIIPIKHLARVGNGSTPLRDNEAYWQNGAYPWLTSTVVNDELVGEPTDWVTPTALRECHLPFVPPNSVLVAITGQGKTRGKAAILPYEATINQHLAYLSPYQNRLDSTYLQLSLTASYDVLRMVSEGTGSTKGALTCEQLGAFPITLPPLTEQKQIIAHINGQRTVIDDLMKATQITISLLQERRSALIAAAVTGQIDMTEPSCN